MNRGKANKVNRASKGSKVNRANTTRKRVASRTRKRERSLRPMIGGSA